MLWYEITLPYTLCNGIRDQTKQRFCIPLKGSMLTADPEPGERIFKEQ
jgi:hypothetical protein